MYWVCLRAFWCCRCPLSGLLSVACISSALLPSPSCPLLTAVSLPPHSLPHSLTPSTTPHFINCCIDSGMVLDVTRCPSLPGLPTPLRSPRGSPKASPAASPAASPKPSPVTSPRAQPKHVASTGCAYRCVHGYLCGRVSLLHVSVVCVLLGITLLVVGLVQLAPGAVLTQAAIFSHTLEGVSRWAWSAGRPGIHVLQTIVAIESPSRWRLSFILRVYRNPGNRGTATRSRLVNIFCQAIVLDTELIDTD
ncbi:hypothetical protein E2C01_042722 [Portunus trituberculatus]|uniref:Uncharacterized protein n=1 Tax=Portunus trituberculatus TaxID=210409 RepID=A0A5B7FUB9_PORTR|nr:hypothetical protein [Portunus trituberculatus]